MRRIAAVATLALIAGVAGCSTGDNGADRVEDGPTQACAQAIADNTGDIPMVWENPMDFPMEDGSISYQGDVVTTDAERRSYLCDVDADGTIVRAGWLSDFGN